MRRYLAGDGELFLYTRYENPTVRALEDDLAALEEGEAALCFASGMAAATTGILSLLEPGDEVLASASLYGGTARFVREVLPRFGFGGRAVPVAEIARLSAHAGPRTKVVVVESPTNPMVEVVDLAAVASAAHDRGIAVFVDNTFATPVLQRPLALGRRPRHAQPEQGAGRPQRRHRRRPGGVAGAHRPGARAAEGAGRLHGPAHRVPRPPRPEDRPPPRAAPVRERARARARAGRPSRRSPASSIRGCPAIPATRSRSGR